MARKYQIWFNQDDDEQITSWFVTDMTEAEKDLDAKKKKNMSITEQWRHRDQNSIRPRVATFPVSALHDADSQERRAKMFADYMNKINEVTETAVSQAALVDLISATPVNGKK